MSVCFGWSICDDTKQSMIDKHAFELTWKGVYSEVKACYGGVPLVMLCAG